MQKFHFKPTFKWGCATASYQIEGAVEADGRGPSIWDKFSRSPGRILMDHTGDVAADHYHRYEEDLDLLQDLGVDMYRFSVAWPRLLPDESRRPNPKGIEFYDRLIDGMLARGIEPWLTCYHWDLPLWLQESLGGWENRETCDYFQEYVQLLVERYSDRVSHWFTINEPLIIADYGYKAGIVAPGKRLPEKEVAQVRHHVLLAHGVALKTIRDHTRQPAKVGFADNPLPMVPLWESPEHIAAATEAYRQENAAFLTAIMEGGYTPEYLAKLGSDAPEVREGDFALIGAPMDHLGINAYFPNYVTADSSAASGYRIVEKSPSHPRMHSSWLYFDADILYWTAKMTHELWEVPSIVISENGCSCDDRLTEDGEVWDTDRIMYLKHHWQALSRAAQEGVPVDGCFVWSLLDNYEWMDGYTRRFGIHYVNYSTQERTAKASAKFMRATIRDWKEHQADR